MKIPVFCYKVRFRKAKGKVTINSNEIQTGMIKFGDDLVGIYPNDGLCWENSGNVIFQGRARIGNNCSICVGRNGTLDFGEEFVANAATKIVCAFSIKFSYNVTIGWENLIMDTSFHRIKGIDGNFIGKGYGEIRIGKQTWTGAKCNIFPEAKIPSYCIIGAGTFINKDISDWPTHIMIAGNPAQIKKRDVWRDAKDDALEIEF